MIEHRGRNCRHPGRADRLAERALLAMLGAHLVLGLLFALSLVGAASSATIGQTCAGDNLVETLAREDPGRLARARAEAAEVENGDAIFWKISKPGTKPSFLFGTMHSADPRVARMPPAVEAAFAAAGTVIIESTETLDQKKMAAATLALKQYTLLTDGTTLERYLPDEMHPRLKAAVEAHGMPWNLARRFQPWMISAAIALPACELAAKQAGAAVLDTMIGQRAEAEGKRLVGLETIEEQFAAIASVPREFHATALKETLELGDLSESVMETTKALYLEGNTALLIPLIRVFAPQTYAGAGYGEFRERLIAGRNETMVERAVGHLEEGDVFMAVGALHLPGGRGLVALLRQHGFTVEPAGR